MSVRRLAVLAISATVYCVSMGKAFYNCIARLAVADPREVCKPLKFPPTSSGMKSSEPCSLQCC